MISLYGILNEKYDLGSGAKEKHSINPSNIPDNYYLEITGVLITGGSFRASKTAELYLPSSGKSCSLPGLPQAALEHTVSDGGLLCGGLNNDNQGINDNCLQWRPELGSWQKFLTLGLIRNNHVSWTSENSSTHYLMGGGQTFGSEWWTTLIHPNGTQELGFSLKYKTS